MWPVTVYSAIWPREEAERRVEHRHVDKLRPRRSGVRWNSALDTAKAAVMPPIVSHSAKPARVGPLSSWPVIDMMPDIACNLPSKAAVPRSGPFWPKPDTAQ